MKWIVWLGKDAVIPYHGKATNGEAICLSDKLAESYLSQGLAIPVEPANELEEVTENE